MHTEDDLLPISALQHLLFCERQTALIHLERLWADNRFTSEGNVLHRKADAARSETRDGVRITRSLPVHSFELGLYGVCDVVQFIPPESERPSRISLAKRIEQELMRTRSGGTEQHEVRAETSDPCLRRADGEEAVSMQASPMARVKRRFGGWDIRPVEYKRGKPKANDCDRVQLCAQAMCLEEMLSVTIRHGDLFYGKKQRRTAVAFDNKLRETTRETSRRLHELIESQKTPQAVREKKCDTCSLLELCMPLPARRSTASDYLRNAIDDIG